MEFWLQGLSNEMKASGGYKLPRSYLIRNLLDAAMELNVDASGVRSEKELKERFIRAIRKYKKK